MASLLRTLQMEGASRFEDAALLALRAATGLFLLYQSHDNLLHWSQTFDGWWPAAILVFLGLYFFARGSGRYGLDTVLSNRERMGPA